MAVSAAMFPASWERERVETGEVAGGGGVVVYGTDPVSFPHQLLVNFSSR